jgi:hypothetical protein
MLSGEDNQAVMLIALAGSLAVGASIFHLGMGMGNLLAADSAERLSSFGVTGNRAALPPAPAAGAFADIDYLREEITARRDQSAVLLSETARLARELDRERAMQARREAVAKPETTDVEGVPMEAPALTAAVAKAEAEIQRVRQEQQDSTRVNVARWFPAKAGENRQWIECRKDEAVLQPQAVHLSARDWEGKGDGFLAAWNADRAVLLVRPSGYASCAGVRALLESSHIDYELAPVDESWQLAFQ